MRISSHLQRAGQIGLTVLLTLGISPPLASAQSPWETAASRLQTAFTGPMATALSIVAIAVGGFVLMFGDGAGKRMLAGLIAGIAMAIGAQRWLQWLFL